MHPSLRIISLFLTAIVLYCVSGNVLNCLFIVAVGLLLILDLLQFKRIKSKAIATPDFKFTNCSEWLKLIKRLRYILLFLLMVYAFNTPGEYLAGWDFVLTPTYEGITAGIEQILRLALILAGLALLLANTSREQLIAGLYHLSQPFRHVGLDPERFAVRLWLTLYYVEHSQQAERQTMLHQLKNLEGLAETDELAPEKITLIKLQMRWQDYFLLALMLLGVYLLCV